MAELKNMLLTAGHDLELVQGGLTIDVSLSMETYTMLRGKEQMLKAGDMFICDEEGILSSIIYGPDRPTQITRRTRAVVFTVYAPPGVAGAELDSYLCNLQTNVQLFSPRAEIECCEVLTAG